MAGVLTVAGATAVPRAAACANLPTLQKMAIAEIKIKIPAATAANFQLGQCPDPLAAEITVDEPAAAVCARKAASSAASTRAGGSSPTSLGRDGAHAGKQGPLFGQSRSAASTTFRVDQALLARCGIQQAISREG